MIPRSLNLASFDDTLRDGFDLMTAGEHEGRGVSSVRSDGYGRVFAFSYGESGVLSDVRLFETSDNYSESEEL
jgi:hypothetical protein